MCAPSVARISSSSFTGSPPVSRFCVFWIRNTIRNVMIVVPVLMTSCQVSLKPKSGPVSAPEHDDARPQRRRRSAGRPLRRPLGETGEPAPRASRPHRQQPQQFRCLDRLARASRGRAGPAPAASSAGESGQRLDQRIAHQPVEHALTLAPAGDQPGVLEHRKVARDGRRADARSAAASSPVVRSRSASERSMPRRGPEASASRPGRHALSDVNRFANRLNDCAHRGSR